MGVMQKLESLSRRNSRPQLRNVSKKQFAGVSMTNTKEVEKLISQLPEAIREKAIPAAQGKAAVILRREYRSVVSTNKDERNFEKKSRNQQRKFGTDNLEKSVGYKSKSYKKSGTVLTMLGPRAPGGPHAHLVEFGHEAVYWGNQSGERVKGKRYLARAVDNVENQFGPAIVRELKRRVKTV